MTKNINFNILHGNFIQIHWSTDFPKILGYNRFLNTIVAINYAYLQTLQRKLTGIAFIGSTSLKVSHNIRIPRHRVFKGSVKRGKGTMG